MTWGRLRLNIETSSPGVPLDLLDEWLNTRYASVLRATDWIGLKGHSRIETIAAYQSGSTEHVTVAIGSSSVIGFNTNWSMALVGLNFYVPGDTAIYSVIQVQSPISLVLDRFYEPTVNTSFANSPYVLMQNIYSLPADCDSVVTVLDAVANLPLHPFTKDGLDVSAGSRATVGEPRAWAVYDDTYTAPVLHQLELFPPPLYARGYLLEYLRLAKPFDGMNLESSPLPWVSDAVLLSGVRADIALFQSQLPKAAAYQLMFEKELARLLLEEHAFRRVKTNLKMADRFTRHRLFRTIRGWGGSQSGTRF